MLVIISVFA